MKYRGTRNTSTALRGKLLGLWQAGRITPFVLRYWETEFPMLEPVKSPSGHRVYRQEDVDMVFKIKRLLYDEGFTIAGARRHLRENGSVASEAIFSGPRAECGPCRVTFDCGSTRAAAVGT